MGLLGLKLDGSKDRLDPVSIRNSSLPQLIRFEEEDEEKEEEIGKLEEKTGRKKGLE